MATPSSEPTSAAPVHQYVFVYCNGERRLAQYLGDGWALCPCGERLRVVA